MRLKRDFYFGGPVVSLDRSSIPCLPKINIYSPPPPKQDKEVLKQEHASDLLLPPVPQCRADEAGFPVPSQDSPPRGPETQPEVTERVLLQDENEVSNMSCLGLPSCSPMSPHGPEHFCLKVDHPKTGSSIVTKGYTL